MKQLKEVADNLFTFLVYFVQKYKKALIIAGTIFSAVLIIPLGVALFLDIRYPVDSLQAQIVLLKVSLAGGIPMLLDLILLGISENWYVLKTVEK